MMRYLLLATLLLWLPWQARAQADTLRYTNWRLEQADEFNTPGDSTQAAAHWQFAYPWGRNLGGFETEYYTGQEVNVRAGSLLLTAHRLPAPRPYPPGPGGRQLRYTSGMLYGRHPGPDSLRPAPCPPGEGISYGLFEIRCRQPYDTGSFPAFWLYGQPDEVDIFEAGGELVSNNVILNAHDYWRPGPVEEPSCQCFYYWPGPARLARQYHRYALEWLPGQLTFYFDGVPIRRETRFRPRGCAMTIIADLAVWAWAGAPTDTLAIDYIRVYRPRRLPAAPFGSAAAQLPRSGVLDFPHQLAPEQSNPPGTQTWELTPAPAGGLELALRDNFNPSCLTTLPLPLGANWHGPWLAGTTATPLAVRLAGPAALTWTLLDAQGQARRQGQASAGWWVPPTAALEPGAYQVRLQVGEAVRYQPLYVLARPTASGPTAEWLQPAPLAQP